MKKKRVVMLLLTMLTLTSLVFASGSAEDPAKADDGVTELTIWARSQDIAAWIPGFEAANPDIKVKLTEIPDQEMTQKLITVIASGKGVPDLFQQEYAYITYLVEAGVFANLNEEPFNVGEYASDIWAPSLRVGTDSEGIVRALTWQAAPGSIIYRRDIAKKYLGTDEPSEVSALLNSDEKMIAVAEAMAADGIRMFSSIKDIYDMKSSSRTQPWVVDGKLVIDPVMEDCMKMIGEVMQNKYELGVDQWAPEWVAAVEGDNLFCYILPSWGYQFVVKPNAKLTEGKWAICEPPAPYINGGTYTGIYKDSPNKEAAWKFLEYVTLNAESQYEYAAKTGDYMSLISVDERLEKESQGESVLGGQNHYEIYNEEMAREFTYLNTIYDSQITNFYISAAKAYGTGASYDDAMAQFKADIANAFPEIVIE